MPWENADETIVAGSGQVYVADVGTALPTTYNGALSPASWIGLGYHSEDGVSVSHAPDVQEFGAWQSRNPIRLERQSNDFRITFSLLQFNEETVPFAFGGGSVTSTGGSGYKFTPPGDEDALDERSLVCDVQDGDTILRFVVPRGAAIEAIESQFTDSAMGMLPITFRALEPDTNDAWYFLTNADFAAGS